MDKNLLNIGFKVLGILIICFCAQFAVLYFTGWHESLSNLEYSLVGLYGFELIFSIVIFFAMIGIAKSLPEQLGFVFLGFITLRLIGSYLFAEQGLDHVDTQDVFKYNFVIIVLIFLGTDAYTAYRVLNK
ncbi:hypothetical protein ACYSNX_03180 [Myroides sp. LJL115]